MFDIVNVFYYLSIALTKKSQFLLNFTPTITMLLPMFVILEYLNETCAIVHYVFSSKYNKICIHRDFLPEGKTKHFVL